MCTHSCCPYTFPSSDESQMAWHGGTLECLPKRFLASATDYRGREVFHAQLASTCVKEVGEKNKIKVLKGSECRAKDLEPYHLFSISTSCSGPRCHHLPVTLHRSPTCKAVTHRSPYSIPSSEDIHKAHWCYRLSGCGCVQGHYEEMWSLIIMLQRQTREETELA